jgi:hypothetical protein
MQTPPTPQPPQTPPELLGMPKIAELVKFYFAQQQISETCKIEQGKILTAMKNNQQPLPAKELAELECKLRLNSVRLQTLEDVLSRCNSQIEEFFAQAEINGESFAPPDPNVDVLIAFYKAQEKITRACADEINKTNAQGEETDSHQTDLLSGQLTANQDVLERLNVHIQRLFRQRDLNYSDYIDFKGLTHFDPYFGGKAL